MISALFTTVLMLSAGTFAMGDKASLHPLGGEAKKINGVPNSVSPLIAVVVQVTVSAGTSPNSNITEKDIERWIIEILNEELKAPQKIVAVPVQKVGLKKYDQYEEAGRLYTLFDIQLSSEGLSIINKKQWKIGNGTEKRKYGPFDYKFTSEIEGQIKITKDALREICREYIAAHMNCAFGGICQGKHKND